MVNFKRDSNEGQLYVEERKKLYDLIKDIKPMVCIEIGTWKGGGSTYIIASALKENDCGKLYTYEVSSAMYLHAKRLYGEGDLEYLKDYVKLNFGNFDCKRFDEINFAFIDGSEDPDETVQQFIDIVRISSDDCIITCHDWMGNKTCKITDEFLDSVGLKLDCVVKTLAVFSKKNNFSEAS